MLLRVILRVETYTHKVKMSNRLPSVVGSYGASFLVLKVIECLRGYEQTQKIALTIKLLEKEVWDETTASHITAWLAPSLTDVLALGRSSKWESLRPEKKVTTEVPHTRYYREQQQLRDWYSGDRRLEDIFAQDLVHVYATLPVHNKEVNYDVTTKKNKIGKYTQLALDHCSMEIMQYQIVHQGLVVSRALLYAAASSKLDSAAMMELLLHTTLVRDDTFSVVMEKLAESGHLQSLRMMIRHETIPDRPAIVQVVSHLVVRSHNKNKLEDDEVPEESDLPRLLWHEFSVLCGKYLGEGKKKWIRDSYFDPALLPSSHSAKDVTN